MTTETPPLYQTHLLKKTLQELKRLRELEKQQHEPIAIIGMACRFPGQSDTPEAFWQLLQRQTEAMTEVPPDRWNVADYYHPDPDRIDKTYSRHGGFLAQVDEFDPAFFGISPVEAIAIDPQQRLLLEVTWEAFEHAGCLPQSFAGSQTGVFVGISQVDYVRLLQNSQPDEKSLPYYSTGNSLNAAAGRMAYVFGLQGPCMAIDTACSSSLVALHQACQSLRSHESQQAIAAGVNLILTPDNTLAISRSRMLAVDGRCKTFDQAADGYVRSEGCGVVLLKRLSDAQAQGDRILAVIAGSAINQDGHSSGFTVPNGSAQQELIRQVLRQAHLQADQIDYVEAHGTGTALGDPIEAGAIHATYGNATHRTHPLWVGAVKTNIGHTEAAAGIAGVIKTVLCLQHQQIPAQKHLHTLNPYIAELNPAFSIPLQPVAWPVSDRVRRAGVSSFGFSGTNAHVILEEAPACPAVSVWPERSLHLCALSAKSLQALDAQLEQYLTYLTKHPDTSVADFCYTANTRQAHFAYRVAFLVTSSEDLKQQIQTQRQTLTDIQPIQPFRTSAAQIALLCIDPEHSNTESGLVFDPSCFVFQEIIEKCADVLYQATGVSLWEEPTHTAIAPEIESERKAFIPLYHFARHYALGKCWEAWGVPVQVILGHGTGAYAAVCLAGMCTVDEAIQMLIVGCQLGLFVSETETNPSQMPAWHTFQEVVQQIDWQAPTCTVLNMHTGKAIGDEIRTPAYWLTQAWTLGNSEASRQALQAEACTCWIETGKALAVQLSHTPQPSPKPIVIHLTPQWESLLMGMKSLYMVGFQIDWKAFDRPYGRTRLGLPSYPFQRQRYWPKPKVSAQTTASIREWLSKDRILHGQVSGMFSEAQQQLLPGLVELLAQLATPETVSKADSELLYKLCWEPTDVPVLVPQPIQSETVWVVLADETDTTTPLAAALQAVGKPCKVVYLPTASLADETVIGTVMQTALDEVQAAGQQPAGICWTLFDTNPSANPFDLERVVSIVAQLRTWLVTCGQDVRLAGCRLVLITRQGWWIPSLPEASVQPVQRALWAACHAFATEFPSASLLRIDIPQVAEPKDWIGVAQLVQQNASENQWVVRNGCCFVPRLARYAAEVQQPVSVVPIQAEAVYLLTGGLGGIGLEVADWLAYAGARHLILVSRSGITQESQRQKIQQLQDRGIHIRIVQADVSTVTGMDTLWQTVDESAWPLKGIIHAAGVIEDALLTHLTSRQLTAVMQPKVQATWLLHTYSAAASLDFFICFSSIASFMSMVGQTAYAAANGWMDAWMQYRRQQGLPALGVHWGPWKVGMTTRLSDNYQQLQDSLGIQLLAVGKAWQGLDAMLAPQVDGELIVVDADWHRLAKTSYRQSPVFRRVLPQEVLSADEPVAYRVLLQNSLPEDQPAYLHQYLCTLVQEVARLPLAAVSANVSLTSLGVDSLMAVRMRHAVMMDLGLELDIAQIMEGADMSSLVQTLVVAWQKQPSSGPLSADLPSAAISTTEIQAEEAKHLLTDIDTLSPEEMDELLAHLLKQS